MRPDDCFLFRREKNILPPTPAKSQARMSDQAKENQKNLEASWGERGRRDAQTAPFPLLMAELAARHQRGGFANGTYLQAPPIGNNCPPEERLGSILSGFDGCVERSIVSEYRGQQMNRRRGLSGAFPGIGIACIMLG